MLSALMTVPANSSASASASADLPHAVLTLIAADPNAGPLGEAITALHETLVTLGAGVGKIDWLAPGRACDLYYQGLDADQADAGARHRLAADFPRLAADIVVQPSAGRRKA